MFFASAFGSSNNTSRNTPAEDGTLKKDSLIECWAKIFPHLWGELQTPCLPHAVQPEDMLDQLTGAWSDEQNEWSLWKTVHNSKNDGLSVVRGKTSHEVHGGVQPLAMGNRQGVEQTCGMPMQRLPLSTHQTDSDERLSVLSHEEAQEMQQ